jgi:hypothetical protein
MDVPQQRGTRPYITYQRVNTKQSSSQVPDQISRRSLVVAETPTDLEVNLIHKGWRGDQRDMRWLGLDHFRGKITDGASMAYLMSEY